jgi:hypothetical protein
VIGGSLFSIFPYRDYVTNLVKEVCIFDSLVVQWGTLLGFAALIAALINNLKLVGVVKPDLERSAQPGRPGSLFLDKFFASDLDVPSLDQQAAEFAIVVVLVN